MTADQTLLQNGSLPDCRLCDSCCIGGCCSIATYDCQLRHAAQSQPLPGCLLQKELVHLQRQGTEIYNLRFRLYTTPTSVPCQHIQEDDPLLLRPIGKETF